jgi:hypothetical protein
MGDKNVMKQPKPEPPATPPPTTDPQPVPQGIDKKTMDMIMAADLANIVRKVKAGKPLSKQERRLVAQQAVESDTKRTTKKFRTSTSAGKGNWQQRFLEALSDIPNVTHACEKSHVRRNTAYDTRNNSKRFRDQWDKALVVGIERLECAAYDRARNGVSENVWMKDEDGKPVLVDTVRRYSDTLAMFLLKAHNPLKYREPRESTSATITAPDGSSLTMTLVQSPIDPEEVTGPAPVKLLGE